jgi:hypothetical protein
LPITPKTQFKNYDKLLKAPVVIYADFETLIMPTNNIHNYSDNNTIYGKDKVRDHDHISRLY